MYDKQKGEGSIDGVVSLAVFGWVFAAWLTHIIFCLKTGAWGFLIAGAILFPIGVVHGTGLWFGFFG